MSDIEQIDETEREQFNEFKKKLRLQAAESQMNKLEFEMTSAVVEKGELKRACQAANELKLGAICVLPSLVRPCVGFLGRDPQTSLIACISFPHGGDTTATKVKTVKNAIKDGVDEVEVTAPIPYVKSGDWGYVKRELKKLKNAAKKRALRINLECNLLTEAEIAKLCTVAADCGITSLRVSSGMFPEALSQRIVAQVKTVVKDKCTIKAVRVSNMTELSEAVDLGAGIIGSRNAADIARLIIQSAEVN